MFSWFRHRRRRRLLAQPFPSDWEEILRAHARFAEDFTAAQHVKLRQSIQLLVPEKNWEGCGGLRLTDEHRVTIAAQIARMTLHFDNELFDEVLSILVYPGAYQATSRDPLSGGLVIESASGRAGEAWHRGPVILSWDDVMENVFDPTPHRNLVIHEFAHQLDMRNGSHADGFPVIESPVWAERWRQVLPASYDELTQLCQQHIPSILDCYGATSPAELFAVASESYFEQAVELRFQWPQLFELLDHFYSDK